MAFFLTDAVGRAILFSDYPQVSAIAQRNHLMDHVGPLDSSEKYYESKDIRYCCVDDVVILLDLRDGKYISLNPTATVMWQALLSADSTSERYRTLEQRFDIPAERVASDFARFTHACLEQGYILREPAKPPERNLPVLPHRAGLPLIAWWFMITTKRHLVRHGFSKTYRACHALAKPTLTDVSDGYIARFENAFALAENFFVMRDAPKDCLPRSLALYRFLLACGVPVEHWIGVKTLPFRAHAWVEFNRKAIRDSQSYVDSYAKIASL